MSQYELGLRDGFADQFERGSGRPPRGYYLDGERIPSASTIAGRFKDGSGLIRWAFNRGRSGAEDLYDERALDIGSLVHKCIECELGGVPSPDIPDEYRAPVESALNAWHEWFLSQNFEIVATEVPLVSRKHRFGGTIDSIVRDRHGRLAVGDWKSSKAVYPDYLVQIAGYRILWEENRGPVTGGYHLARFSKEDGYFSSRYYPDLAKAERLFLLYRDAYDLDKQLGSMTK